MNHRIEKLGQEMLNKFFVVLISTIYFILVTNVAWAKEATKKASVKIIQGTTLANRQEFSKNKDWEDATPQEQKEFLEKLNQRQEKQLYRLGKQQERQAQRQARYKNKISRAKMKSQKIASRRRPVILRLDGKINMGHAQARSVSLNPAVINKSITRRFSARGAARLSRPNIASGFAKSKMRFNELPPLIQSLKGRNVGNFQRPMNVGNFQRPMMVRRSVGGNTAFSNKFTNFMQSFKQKQRSVNGNRFSFQGGPVFRLVRH